MKALHLSKHFHPSVSVFPMNAVPSMFSTWFFFFFFNLFSPTSQSSFSYTHHLSLSPPSTAMSPGDAIDHPFLFPQADFKTRPMPSSSFLSWSNNDLIHEATGGRPAAPGPTGDKWLVQLNHNRVNAIVSTVAPTYANVQTEQAPAKMLSCMITHC